MPCYNLKVRFTVSLPNVQKDILTEALKLMGATGVQFSDFWVNDGVSFVHGGRRHIAKLKDGKLEMEVGSEALAKEVLKYYSTAAQVISLKKQNFQVSLQKEGDLVRIRARK